MHTLTYNKILRDLEATSIYRKLPPKKPILLTSWTLCHYVYVFASLRIGTCILYNGLFVSKGFRLGKKVYSIVFDILAPNSCREWFCSICPTKRIHTYPQLVAVGEIGCGWKQWVCRGGSLLAWQRVTLFGTQYNQPKWCIGYTIESENNRRLSSKCSMYAMTIS